MNEAQLKQLDVVYFCRGGENEELRYSLRSVEQNLPHRKVWVYGEKPEWCHPDEYVQTEQVGESKWERVRGMLREACRNPKISENFVLMNDDFYVMKPIKELPPYYDSLVCRKIVLMELKNNNMVDKYTLMLRHTVSALTGLSGCLKNYAVHMPMIINRQKMLEAMGAYPSVLSFRVLYGNYARIGGESHPDVKVYAADGGNFDRDADFLSSEDKAFVEDAEFGGFIRQRFPEPSEFERRKGVSPFSFINHENSPEWTERNQKLRESENGAVTYSRGITKHYEPVFRRYFENGERHVLLCSVISEKTPPSFPDYDLIFVFLHQCHSRYQPVLETARNFVNQNPQAQVVFIVWHEGCQADLQAAGFNAEFVPMAIDLEEIRAAKVKVPKYNDRIIYFGNLRGVKLGNFQYFKQEAEQLGVHVDKISGCIFNDDRDHKLSRAEVLMLLQHYKYGVGVGICAHEMAALGLKVILYAYDQKCCCAYTKEQADHYWRRNLCSRDETDVPVRDAVQNLDKLVRFEPIGLEDNVDRIEKICQKYGGKERR